MSQIAQRLDSGQTKQPIMSHQEVTALSHLYRGELYRSKIWRTRLDATTNWAVGTTGLALSITFSSQEASAMPIIVVALLVAVFLGVEARRYRYFDIWRTRVRVIEVGFFGPILRGNGVSLQSGWNELLADDYEHLQFHISYLEAFGRRLRRNYIWIFGVLGVAYLAKLAMHPASASSWQQVIDRAAIGPMHGAAVLVSMAIAYSLLGFIAIGTLGGQKAVGRVRYLDDSERELLKTRLQI
jgi:uncharacterized membrane protein